MNRTVLIGLVCAAAVACAPPITAVRTYSATYACEGGRSIHVQFSTGAAVLESDGGPVAMNQERTADGFLYVGGGQSLRGRGHDATWTEHGKARACRDTAGDPAKVKSALMDTAWQLIRFQNASGDDVVPPNLDRYTLRFLADGALALQLDCNRANGRWKDAPSDAGSGNLILSGGAMTRAMCGPGAIDTQIARDLEKVHHYDVRGGRLSLRLQDGSRYEWSSIANTG